MLISKFVKTKWNNRTKKYYIKLGYAFTKMFDEFEVKIEDLLNGSNVEVKVLCDYCKKEIIDMTWEEYQRQTNISQRKSIALIENHCCNTCRKEIEYEFIKQEFLKKDYILISQEFIKSSSPLKYICPMHPNKIQQISYNRFSNGQGCFDCGRKDIHDKLRLDFNFIKNRFKDMNYLLLETKYINNETPMKYICLKHISEGVKTVKFKHILFTNSGCRTCGYEKNSGENNAYWKGGVSTVSNYLRKKIISWKKDSMANCNYKCVITGNKFDAIHHLYGFDLIIEELFKITEFPIYQIIGEYTNIQLKELENKCVELHNKYSLGVCLAKNVHDLFHSIYGRGQNTPEQFEEFKQRYGNGEFNEILKEVI